MTLTLIATVKDVNNAEIESAEKINIHLRGHLHKYGNNTDNASKIINSWSAIEKTILERLNSSGIDASSFNSRNLLEAALKATLITQNQFRSLRGLNAMRNLAAHGDVEQIDEKRTNEFLMLADAMRTVLEISDRTK